LKIVNFSSSSDVFTGDFLPFVGDKMAEIVFIFFHPLSADKFAALRKFISRQEVLDFMT